MPTIAERLTELADAKAKVKALEADLRADYDGLKAALPRTRKRSEPKPKPRGRPRKINGGTAPTIEDLA